MKLGLFISLAMIFVFTTAYGGDSECGASFLDSYSLVAQNELKLRGIDPQHAPNLNDIFRISVEGFEDAESSRVNGQIEQVALFLKDLYVSALGDSNQVPICQVVVCPKSHTGQWRNMSQQGDKLYIGLSAWRNRPIAAFRLRQKFDRGDHLDRNSPVKPYWGFVNPVGDARILVRDALRATAKRISGEISNALAAGMDSEASIEASLLNLISLHVRVDVLEEKHRNSIAGLSADQRVKLMELWRDALLDPTHANRMAEEIIHYSADDKITANIEAWLIAWGNLKRVVVNASPVSKYVRPITRQEPINIKVKGRLYAHYTIDDIHVNLLIPVDGSLESYTFEMALRQVLSGSKLDD